MNAQINGAMKAGNAARLSAAAYRRRCAAGEIDMETAIRECTEALTLLQLLLSFRRYRFTKAEHLARMADLITLDIRMGGRLGGRKRLITEAERQRLIDALHGKRTNRITTWTVPAKGQSDAELLGRLMAAKCSAAQVAVFFSISHEAAYARVWRVRQREAA